jgi:hypothetical protein
MPKESPSDKLSISPAEEITAFLGNCRELAMHQRIGDVVAVLRATKKIAESLGLPNDEMYDSLIESVKSKPFYVFRADVDRAIQILNSPKNKKKS